jgi:PRTRC genetic system protein C
MPRLFVYDGRTFPDPDSRLSVEDVRRQLADYFPELANADTREELRGEDTVYSFSRRIGTKGGGRRKRRPPDVVAILRRVRARELRVFELAAELLLKDGSLDVDAAGRRQPELTLAEAEAEAYAGATQRAVTSLKRLRVG